MSRLESERAPDSGSQVADQQLEVLWGQVTRPRPRNRSGSPTLERGAKNCTGECKSEMRALGVAGDDFEAHDADEKHPGTPTGVLSSDETPRREDTIKGELLAGFDEQPTLTLEQIARNSQVSESDWNRVKEDFMRKMREGKEK